MHARYGVAVALVVILASCRKQDLRTQTIRVPEMKNAACASIVAEALQRQQGIPPEWIKVDIENRTVTVTYDSLQRALKNLEFAIADAGFQANETPANPEAAAKLPPECR